MTKPESALKVGKSIKDHHPNWEIEQRLPSGDQTWFAGKYPIVFTDFPVFKEDVGRANPPNHIKPLKSNHFPIFWIENDRKIV